MSLFLFCGGGGIAIYFWGVIDNLSVGALPCFFFDTGF